VGVELAVGDGPRTRPNEPRPEESDASHIAARRPAAVEVTCGTLAAVERMSMAKLPPSASPLTS
jgi:hypothetical protein